jgi:hypothetical protein
MHIYKVNNPFKEKKKLFKNRYFLFKLNKFTISDT